MSTQLNEIESLLESASKEDLVLIARRALDKLFALGATDKLGECVLMPEDDAKDVFIISPLRPAETLNSDEEELAEVKRRANSLNQRFLSDRKSVV